MDSKVVAERIGELHDNPWPNTDVIAHDVFRERRNSALDPALDELGMRQVEGALAKKRNQTTPVS